LRRLLKTGRQPHVLQQVTVERAEQALARLFIAGLAGKAVEHGRRGGLARQARDEEPRQSLLGALYRYLLEHVRLAPGLEQTAQHFGISPATLKRRLLAHGTHFQAELDQVRTHVALQLYQCRGFDNEQVARYLGFNDAANFRRSFKRWTGLTPSSLRDSLDPPLMA
ncbi:MAG: helix-turn-helix transcriptional regulator, partial [Rhizobacter sp.]|nr:helix-turn-helix transcriptional regulator [Rhizobacter sp.]